MKPLVPALRLTLEQAAKAHLARSAGLLAVRGLHHLEQQRLSFTRAEGMHATEVRVLQRLEEVLVRELESREPLHGRIQPDGPQPLPEKVREPSTELARRAHPAETESTGSRPLSTTGTRPPGAPQSLKAEALISLVRKIELLARGPQPLLALQVGGRVDSEVVVERTGPNQVGLTLRGRLQAAPDSLVAELREALLDRGLRLSTLEVR